MHYFKLIFIVAFSLLIYTSCEKIETVDPIPSIHFEKFDVVQARDSLGNFYYGGNLLFTFKDDDGGDLTGVVQGDNLNDTIYSFIFSPFKKINSLYEPADYNIDSFFLIYNYETDYTEIEKKGQNKSLKGEITVNITTSFNIKPSDTLRYEFYLLDRQKNKSNTEVTNDIVFK